jgi:hypothetical protein
MIQTKQFYGKRFGACTAVTIDISVFMDVTPGVSFRGLFYVVVSVFTYKERRVFVS